MKCLCPYCGEELEEGNLSTSGSISLYYSPKHEYSRLEMLEKGVKNRGHIMLDGPHWSRFNYISVPCHICRSCGKIIISVPSD